MNNLLISDEKTIKSAFLWGVPLIFILASLFHFLYAVTGNTFISAVIFPTNESIFSHLKLAYFPSILYYLVSYLVLYKSININTSKWIISLTAATSINIVFIISSYYVLTAGFNIHSLIVDIGLMFAGTLLGQLMASHVYKYINASKSKLIIALIFLLILLVLFYTFTFNPPNLPVFVA